MSGVLKKKELAKISSPEQLDKVITITSPLSWLALLGVTLIMVVTIIWSVLGTIPVTITTQGIVASPVGTNAVYMSESGTVVSYFVATGSELHLGDPVLSYRTTNNEIKVVYSDQVGKVTELLVSIGDSVNQSNEVVRVSPSAVGPQVIVCYVPISQAKKIERGMDTKIFLDSVESQSHGNMMARVINIDAYVTSNSGMEEVLGSDNNMIGTFQNNGPVVAITCELYPDDTVSGYYWSNEKGKQVAVTNGTTVSAKIVIEEIAPITKLFSKLVEIWG